MSGSTSYSFKAVVVMLNDFRVTGFFEGDDAVIVDRNNSTATPMIGADGTSTVSISADDTAMITLKLQPGSPTNRYLENLHKRQRAGSLMDFPLSVVETRTKEGGSSPGCSIVKRPSRSFGTNATVREWQIFAPCWADSEVVEA